MLLLSVASVETRTLVLGVVGVFLSFLILNFFNPWRFFLVYRHSSYY